MRTKTFSVLLAVLLLVITLIPNAAFATPTTRLQLYKVGTGSSCTGALTLITTGVPILTPGQCYRWHMDATDLSGHDHMKLTVTSASYWTNITWYKDVDLFNICTSGSLWYECNGGDNSYAVTSITLQAVVDPNIDNDPLPPPGYVTAFGEDIGGPYRSTVQRQYIP